MPVFLIVALIVLFAVGIYAERTLYLRQNRTAIAFRHWLTDIWQKTQVALQDIQNSGQTLLQPRSDLSAPMRDWVEKHLNHEPELQKWLLALPEKGWQALVEHLGMFCEQLNFDVEWLVNGDLNASPTLAQKGEEIAIHYFKACWLAVQAQSEMNLFRTYLNTLTQLSREEYRIISQQLLARLSQQKLTDPINPEMVLAGDDERRTYVANTLRQAAQKDAVTFNEIFEEVTGIKR